MACPQILTCPAYDTDVTYKNTGMRGLDKDFCDGLSETLVAARCPFYVTDDQLAQAVEAEFPDMERHIQRQDPSQG